MHIVNRSQFADNISIRLPNVNDDNAIIAEWKELKKHFLDKSTSSTMVLLHALK